MLHTKDNHFLDWSTLAPFDSRNLAFKPCLGAPAQADFTNFPLVIIVSMCWPVPGHWHLADTTPSTGVMSHVMVTCHNTLDSTPVPVLECCKVKSVGVDTQHSTGEVTITNILHQEVNYLLVNVFVLSYAVIHMIWPYSYEGSSRVKSSNKAG